MGSWIVLGSALSITFGMLMSVMAVFLILLVMVQRGRGGGLAGAFGGMGGQSAFGTKAGDTFTRVTIVVAAFWIVLCVASVKFLGTQPGRFGTETDGIGRPPALPAEQESPDAEGGAPVGSPAEPGPAPEP
jgi:preprotein translocase subunit SecG